MIAIEFVSEVSPAHSEDRSWDARRLCPVAALVLLAAVVQILRGSGVRVWRSMFGEDGGIFLTQALASHGWGSLLTPYQGYLQVAARLPAELVAMLPLSVAAFALAGIAALGVALLALFTYHASATLLQSRWARLAVAGAPVLLPAAYETVANVTDLHWYLDYACFWAVVVPFRRSRVVGCAAVGIVALAALSDPLVGLFLPLAVWRAVHAPGLVAFARRSAARRSELRSSLSRLVGVESLAALALAVGLAMQLLLGVLQQPAGHFQNSHAGDLPSIYGLRVAGSFLFGDRYLASLFVALGELVALGSLAVVVVAFGFALRRAARPGVVLLAVGYSVIWLIVPLMLRGTDALLPEEVAGLAGSRYTVVPILLLIVGGVALLDRPVASARRSRPASPTRPQLAATGFFLVLAALNFTITSQRTHGPVWTAELGAARQRCDASAGYPREVGRSAEAPWGLPAGPADVLIPVAPGGPTPAWSVVVPCSRIVATSS